MLVRGAFLCMMKKNMLTFKDQWKNIVFHLMYMSSSYVVLNNWIETHSWERQHYFKPYTFLVDFQTFVLETESSFWSSLAMVTFRAISDACWPEPSPAQTIRAFDLIWPKMPCFFLQMTLTCSLTKRIKHPVSLHSKWWLAPIYWITFVIYTKLAGSSWDSR